MSRAAISTAKQQKIETELGTLETLTHAELKLHYTELTNEPPPKRIRRKLLTLAVAYEIQRKAHRALVERAHRRLEAIGAATSPEGCSRLPHKSLAPGGRLVREWHGKTYEVYVADNGVYWDGAHYRSLSAVAKAITGVNWNGPAFFGLRSASP